MNEGKLSGSSMMGWLIGKPLEIMLEAEKFYSSEGELVQSKLDKLVQEKDPRLKLRVLEIPLGELLGQNEKKMAEFVENFKKERDKDFPSYRFFCALSFLPIDKGKISREEWFKRGFDVFESDWGEIVLENFHKSRFESVSAPVDSGRIYVGIMLATREAYLEDQKLRSV